MLRMKRGQKKMQTTDINVRQFAEMLRYLDPHPPMTEELHCWKKPYSSEKEHMYYWFRGQITNGSGSYGRDEPNNSARTTYNRLLAPGAMLWIAEVLGETPELLNAAVQAAKKAEEVHWRARGNGFRDVIPFDRVYELYQHPENWVYEQQLLPLIGRDESGYPFPIKKTKLRETLRNEGLY